MQVHCGLLAAVRLWGFPSTVETLPPTRGESHIVLENPYPRSLSKAGLSWLRVKRKLPRMRCGESELGGSVAADTPCAWSGRALGQGQTRLSCSREKDWQIWCDAQLLYWALCQCWFSSMFLVSLVCTKDFILDQVPVFCRTQFL